LNRSLSIVVPAYNEEDRLPKTLRLIDEFLNKRQWNFREVIVVDDGSKDATVNVAEDFARDHEGVRVIKNPGNRGKGYAVRHGMQHANGEWCLFTDADLSAPIDELDKLFQATDSGADVAIGSRALDRSLIGIHQPGMRETAGKLFNAVMRLAVGLKISDTQCGFKLFSAKAAKAIFPRQQLDRFGFDVEVLFLAKICGFRIAEIPVRWDHYEGSRVGMLTGLRAFAELVEIRVNSLKGKYR
jgi:dolichyl-phosphate beta-glucosyltransferase